MGWWWDGDRWWICDDWTHEPFEFGGKCSSFDHCTWSCVGHLAFWRSEVRGGGLTPTGAEGGTGDEVVQVLAIFRLRTCRSRVDRTHREVCDLRVFAMWFTWRFGTFCDLNVLSNCCLTAPNRASSGDMSQDEKCTARAGKVEGTWGNQSCVAVQWFKGISTICSDYQLCFASNRGCALLQLIPAALDFGRPNGWPHSISRTPEPTFGRWAGRIWKHAAGLGVHSAFCLAIFALLILESFADLEGLWVDVHWKHLDYMCMCAFAMLRFAWRFGAFCDLNFLSNCCLTAPNPASGDMSQDEKHKTHEISKWAGHRFATWGHAITNGQKYQNQLCVAAKDWTQNVKCHGFGLHPFKAIISICLTTSIVVDTCRYYDQRQGIWNAALFFYDSSWVDSVEQSLFLSLLAFRRG